MERAELAARAATWEQPGHRVGPLVVETMFLKLLATAGQRARRRLVMPTSLGLSLAQDLDL
jgi:hypothetical protein